MLKLLAAVDSIDMRNEFRQLLEHTTIESFMNLEENFGKKKLFISDLLDKDFDYANTLKDIERRVKSFPSYSVLCFDYYYHVIQR